MSEAGQTLKPTGSLTMKEVPGWHAKTHAAEALPASVDLSDVARTDSSALAWLLDLQAKAKQQQRVITFTHPPEALVTLAQLSGVETLLGWENKTSSAQTSTTTKAGS
ncbi:MAG TPA: STAS domain-containing protein [Wenzhouxiangella sp.]